MAMTPKENILACLKHEPYEYVPDFMTDEIVCGFGGLPGPAFEKGPMGGGPDGFGVNWVTPASGGGAPIPEPGNFIMDSETIVDWKKLVHFPDITAFDWAGQAAMEMQIMHGNPDIQAIEFGSGNGPFERMAALMGFEEALIAMAVEPEACFDLMDAIADFKIQVAEYAKKYYHADTFTNYDDIATERGTFMSADAYREMIKPAHTKINKAVRELGMLPIQHTCGKADSLVQDFIETGAAAWTSVQPINDIAGILEKYGDRFCIMGGYNTNGAPGQSTATDKDCENEIQRCYETYGRLPGFMMFAFRLTNTLDPSKSMEANMPLIKASMKWRQIIRPEFK